jgi:pyruvate/2-oxoglutarate dehydrogenase complex dihydrolipoamide acyltransferase (E2) component
MQSPVVLPEIGLEPGTEMVLSFWFADEGEEVFEGDRLVEILAGSVTFDIPAPVTGRLVQLQAVEDDLVQCGDVLALVETNDEVEEN